MTFNTPKSIYIHIPFCLDKCHYCAFVSYKNMLNYQHEYFNSLIKEIKNTLTRQKPLIKTLYIGGGTPSIAAIDNYKALFKELENIVEFESSAEITFEVNPATANLNYFKNLRALGINRLSIGAQTFDEQILKQINRKHSPTDTIITVQNAIEAGFSNISLDLIYGLPAQTLEIFMNDLKAATNLDIKHISAYGLKIEEGTEFAKNNLKNLPDDDLCADIYLETIQALENKGFKHYEISNFAKPQHQSEHNKNYWQNNEYYGFGLAAHSYLNNTRQSNSSDLKQYIKNPIPKKFSQELNHQEQIEEGIFLGLRMTDGIDIESFKNRYNFDITEHYSKVIKKYSEFNLLKTESGRLALTPEGLLLSNTIMAEFIS